ncbi:hypothetical protein I4U23_023642 [Adineta vaga]|nr:hypothetical protein I4U23_023642 [Adineta vaga]
MNGQENQRSHFLRSRFLPSDTFISSLRQLFSILDKTNCGYVSFDLFKRYFDCSSSTLDFLNELEIESKSNNYYITFNLLLNVIQRTLSTTKQPPSIQISKSKHSFVSIEQEIPIMYRNSNVFNSRHQRKSSSRLNSTDFSMIRSYKQYELERNLLLQTCDTLDRVKSYLTDRLVDMKEKQKSYCQHLTTAEIAGFAPESMYNRDLIADLFKLAYTVLLDVNYDFKKSFDHSSSSSSSCSSIHGKELKDKDNYIKRLETEKRVLLKELIEMKQQYGTSIPIQIS